MTENEQLSTNGGLTLVAILITSVAISVLAAIGAYTVVGWFL